jgi:PKD repeat protein
MMRSGGREGTPVLLFIAASLAAALMALMLPRSAMAADTPRAACEMPNVRQVAAALEMYLDAEFTASPTAGIVPLEVHFTDMTTGGAESWLWEFGDGATSTAQDPPHEYVTPGTYTVTLTVERPEGADTETKADYITVIGPGPTADFTGSPASGVVPLAVTFEDLSNGTVTSWLWEFGDGATSTAQDPTHVYLTPGTYTVTLTVEGPEGADAETKAHYITVIGPGPTADFTGSPTSGVLPVTVLFEDLSSGTITSRLWEFGDGATSTAQNPTHEYVTAGHHPVRLTVTGRTGEDTHTKTGYITVTFGDTPLDYWAGGEILACVDAGIVSGYGDHCYHPDWAVDRAQMAVYVSRAVAGGDENIPDRTAAPSFNDVDCSHWACEYISYAAQQGIVQGYPDGSYRPTELVTRDQMAVYIARSICDPTGEDGLADYAPSDPHDFADVAPTGYGPDGTEPHWAYGYVEYCAENGVVEGYDDGLYHPERPVKRDQMAVYVARAFGLPI